LKLKLKSLAAESKFIRDAERRIINYGRVLVGIDTRNYKHGVDDPKSAYNTTPLVFKDARGEVMDEGACIKASEDAYAEFWALREHRMLVRKNARWAHLAYNFLKGRAYEEIEKFTFEADMDWEEVKRQALKFSGEDSRVILQRWAEWEPAAIAYHKKARAAYYKALADKQELLTTNGGM